MDGKAHEHRFLVGMPRKKRWMSRGGCGGTYDTFLVVKIGDEEPPGERSELTVVTKSSDFRLVWMCVFAVSFVGFREYNER